MPRRDLDMANPILIVMPGREEHIARHHVTVEEAREVIHNQSYVRRVAQPGTGIPILDIRVKRSRVAISRCSSFLEVDVYLAS